MRAELVRIEYNRMESNTIDPSRLVNASEFFVPITVFREPFRPMYPYSHRFSERI